VQEQSHRAILLSHCRESTYLGEWIYCGGQAQGMSYNAFIISDLRENFVQTSYNIIKVNTKSESGEISN
jgi:hypothetical protein